MPGYSEICSARVMSLLEAVKRCPNLTITAITVIGLLEDPIGEENQAARFSTPTSRVDSSRVRRARVKRAFPNLLDILSAVARPVSDWKNSSKSKIFMVI